MSRSLDFIGRQALLGWAPRHVLDVTPEAIPVEDTVLDMARELVTEAAGSADRIVDAASHGHRDVPSCD